jgi:hypothetical protein
VRRYARRMKINTPCITVKQTNSGGVFSSAIVQHDYLLRFRSRARRKEF